MNEHRPAGADGASVAELPAGVRRATNYLPEIEALRGIAMLLVYVFHLNPRLMPLPRPDDPIPSPLFAFVAAGHTGVTLFFVLSGFLLSLPFLAEAAGGARVNRRHYFWRRALRILPLYYTAVVFATLMTAHGVADLWHAVPFFLFLNSVSNWSTPMFPYSATWWSLATEVQYYLLLPLLPLLLRSPAGRLFGLGLLLTYATFYAMFLAGWLHVTGDLMLKLSVLGRGPLFLFGIGTAWIYRRSGSRLRDRFLHLTWLRSGGADLVMLASIAAMGMLLRWQLVQGYRLAETVPYFAWHLLEGLLWALILAQLLIAPLRLRAFVVNPVFCHLGVLSYSMYLWHTTFILHVPRWLRLAGYQWPAGWNLRSLVVAAAITLLCLATSQLTYMLIERPFLVRKARVE